MKLLNVTAVDAASNSLLGKKQGCLLKLFLCGELVRTKLNIEQLPWDIENEGFSCSNYCFSYGGASLGAKRPATVKHHGYIGVGKSRRGCTQLCQ